MDRKKVIGGLAACTGETNDCAGHTCPYWDFDDSVVDHGCRIQMELDALALLKEQQEQIDRLIEENASNAEMAEGLKELLKEQEAKWIEYPECLAYDGAYSDSHIVCSACKHVFSIMDNCTEEFDYCPHCGAKMKQEGR